MFHWYVHRRCGERSRGKRTDCSMIAAFLVGVTVWRCLLLLFVACHRTICSRRSAAVDVLPHGADGVCVGRSAASVQAAGSPRRHRALLHLAGGTASCACVCVVVWPGMRLCRSDCPLARARTNDMHLPTCSRAHAAFFLSLFPLLASFPVSPLSPPVLVVMCTHPRNTLTLTHSLCLNCRG